MDLQEPEAAGTPILLEEVAAEVAGGLVNVSGPTVAAQADAR